MKTRKLPPYVERIKGSPNLRYKRRVPPTLQGVLERKLWTESLGTASEREAGKLAAALRVKHDREIAAARGVLDLAPEERERIDAAGGVGGFLQDLDEQARDAKRLDRDSEHMRDVAGLRPIETAFGVWRDPVEVSGDDNDAPDPIKARIKIAAFEATAQAIRDQLARDATLTMKVRPLHPTPTALAEMLEALPADGDRATLGTILEAWKNAKKPVAANQFEVPVREFERLHGQRLLLQIETKHVRQFRDHLAKGELKESTASKHFRCIKTLLKHAVSEGFLKNSPAEGIQWQHEKRKMSESSAEARRTFSVSEVKQLLAKADSLPKDRAKQDVAWFLRVLLWTGARPEEIAQSSPADVAEVHGIWCLRISDADNKKLKNRPSMRDVPIHPKLIELGFLAFVEARKGGELLFSSLKADGRGRVYQRMQRRLSRLIRGMIADARAVPYSFRHTFRDMLRVAEVPQDVGERLMGHTSAGRKISEGYGSAQITVLAKWMARLDPLDERRTVAGLEQ
jgi:integrase